MALTAGTRLGAYEVVSLLGKGGMGEVYRARDTRLHRDVALKIVPEALTSNPDRLARFEREATVLASLNHPNIAAIYGLEEVDGVRALVLELVEGPTLAERVANGAVRVDEALLIAKQIAEALKAAHDAGIIHRDLTPANIKAPPEGVVKLLDFGLAKVVTAATEANLNSPTVSTQATRPGMIWGTPAYMSPEQARGQAVDKRTDIWSFACVLYEMLTGKRAFDMSNTMATVSKSEPDWTRLPDDTQPWLRILIERCLAEDRRHRIADIAVVQFVLADGPKFSEQDVRNSNLPPIVTRFSFTLAKGQQLTENGLRVIAISRDGTQMVYVANRRLYRRPMAEVVARPIPGSEVEKEGFLLDPVFSPDGRSIAFWAGTSPDSGMLKKIPVIGGSPVPICHAMAPFGMSWDAEGILFGALDGILRVAETGGQPHHLVHVEDGTPWRPQMLPGGNAVLFTLADSGAFTGGTEAWDAARIVVHSLTTNEQTTLPQTGTDASYVPTGHVLYVSSGTLFAVPFDASRCQVTGGPLAVVEGIRRPTVGPTTGTAYYSTSDTGTLMFVGGSRSIATVEQDLAFVDRNGTVERLHLQSNQYRFPRVAPDGKHVAVEVGDARTANVWIYDLSGTESPQQLTFGRRNRFPVWSHDGEWLLFQSDRDGDLAVFMQRANGSQAPERLTQPEKGVAHVPYSWSRDGKTVLFDAVLVRDSQTEPFHSHSLSMLSLPDRSVEPFGDVQSSAGPTHAAFSPDDRWVAYVFLEPEHGPSVYVQPFPPTGAKRLVRKGALAPMWSPTGEELFVGGRPDVFRVERVMRTQSGFMLGNPTEQPRPGFIGLIESRNFDIMPDSRIMGVVNAGEPRPRAPTATQIHVVLNWFEELKHLAPTNDLRTLRIPHADRT